MFTFDQIAKETKPKDATRVLIDMQKESIGYVDCGQYRQLGTTFACYLCSVREYNEEEDIMWCPIGGFAVVPASACRKCYPVKLKKIFDKWFENSLVGSFVTAAKNLSENENKEIKWWTTENLKEERKYVG